MQNQLTWKDFIKEYSNQTGGSLKQSMKEAGPIWRQYKISQMQRGGGELDIKIPNIARSLVGKLIQSIVGFKQGTKARITFIDNDPDRNDPKYTTGIVRIIADKNDLSVVSNRVQDFIDKHITSKSIASATSSSATTATAPTAAVSAVGTVGTAGTTTIGKKMVKVEPVKVPKIPRGLIGEMLKKFGTEMRGKGKFTWIENVDESNNKSAKGVIEIETVPGNEDIIRDEIDLMVINALTRAGKQDKADERIAKRAARLGGQPSARQRAELEEYELERRAAAREWKYIPPEGKHWADYSDDDE